MDKKPFGRGRGGPGRRRECWTPEEDTTTDSEISVSDSISGSAPDSDGSDFQTPNCQKLKELLPQFESLSVATFPQNLVEKLDAVDESYQELLEKQSDSKSEDKLADDKCNEFDNEASDYEPTKIEAAHEFRMDSVVSSSTIPFHFFCCVCGLPSGPDCFTCSGRGHPVCRPCQCELKLQDCPYIIPAIPESYVCGNPLLLLKSSFREFMFQNTMVGCLYRDHGCKFEGPWNVVKEHQGACEHANATDK